MKSDFLPVENAIVVVQLPEIRERLQEISSAVQTQVSNALAMEVTEESVKAVKGLRAELNKSFEILEAKRKQAKNAILQPYNEFEGLYKTLISDIYTNGLNTLSGRVTEVENELRARREKELSGFFSEYKQVRCPDADFLTLARTGVKVNLSNTMKSLKDAVKKFTDGVSDDMAAVELYENHAEIMVEYKKTLSLAQAISIVEQRKKQIELQKARSEQQRQERQAREQAQQERDKQFSKQPDNIIPLHPEPLPPPMITKEPEPIHKGEDPVMTMTIRITAPLSKLKALKQVWKDDPDYQVEQIIKGETA